MNGVLIIDKPAGLTSHDVVNRARRLLRERRIGHTGTLDPLATGVLVLCIGKATRLARYLETDNKEYIAELRLGITTDTLDAEGRVLSARSYLPPAPDQVIDVLKHFQGEILQRPPAFSAVKVDGVPSYRLARKGAALVLPARPVTIHCIDLIDYHDPVIRIRVSCSKGTYIRSLCSEIGERLGTGAFLKALIRTRAGRFTLDQALGMNRLTEQAATVGIGGALHTLSEAMGAYPSIVLEGLDAERITHGNSVIMGSGDAPFSHSGLVRVLGPNRELIAIGRLRDDTLRPETVVV